MTQLFLAAMPLGFNPIEILIHLLNLFILVLVLYILLYKPVKKFMAKRTAEYEAIEQDNIESKKEAEEIKKAYEHLLEEARQNAVHISEEAAASALIQTDEMLDTAREQARDILEKAKVEIEHEKARSKEELLFSVSELAVDIATKILEREVKIDDNDVIINSLLDDWKA